MSRYRQTMREALEQVRQQFTEGHSDKDFNPYSDWKKTSGGMYPRFKHSQKGEIQVDRYGEWLHSDKSGKTIAFYRNHFPKTNTTGGTSMKLTDYLKKINEEVINENSTMGYIVKFANRKGEKIAQAWYKDEKSAKEALEAIKKNGGNGIITKGKMNEEGDHEISMARGELEAIADKATQLAGALQGKSDDGNPLEAWVQSKITKAKDYINSVSDYLMYNPDMKQNEETELEEKFALYALRDFTDTRAPGGMRKKGDRASGPMTYTQAIKKAKQMNAGSSIGGSKDVEVRPMKEELEEGFSSSLKQKAKEIAKKFANNMTKAVDEIEKLAKGLSDEPEVYKTIKQYNEEIEVDEKISDIFKANKEGESIDDIAKRLKLSTSMVKKLIGEQQEEQPITDNSQNIIAAKDKEIEALKNQMALMKQKIENEKNKAVKPEPNPETGEVPLTIGIAHKVIRDNQKKEAEEKKQKEVSKQIQSMAKGNDETKLESFTNKYLSHITESAASDKAKALGLDYMSFGRYGKDGKVTHKSVGGNLKALSKKDQEKETDIDKPSKPKTKTTGNIKNPDDTKTTSGQIKKEILKKIDDEDMESDPSIIPEFEDDLLALADDLKGTGDKETAEKITDTILAAGEDDPDTAAKVDDMMNALKGKPDLNTARQKELSKMTSLYTDATYSDKNFKDFVSDTSSIISKMGELADAGSMDSDAYGPGIRSDAMVELVSTASEIQDKIEDMDMNDDIKIDINAALSTITDIDTDEYTEEGPTYLAIQDLKRLFKKLGGNKEKSKASSKASSGAKSELKKAIKNASEPGADFDIKDYDKIQKMAKKAGDKKALDILDKLKKAHKSKDGSEVSYQYVDLYKHLTEEVKNEVSVKSPLFADKEIEEVTQKEIDKFHTDLDSLVHKTFGHSSKEKEKMDEKVADSIIKDLQKAYAPMKGKRISPEMANKISKHLDQKSYDLDVLRQLKKADIPFISTIARNKIYKKTGRFEDRRLYVEAIAGLQKKADKSGMPYNILKQVYDRGMAAWKSGHRPGASQQQWAFARVNSFITKSSGTWGGADKDLAAKVKGSK